MANNYGIMGEEMVRGANGPLNAQAAPQLTPEQQAQQEAQVRASQQASLNQNNPNMPTHGTAAGDAVPMNQQKFGFERPRMDPSQHAPVPAAAFVPGVGMMGPDIGGYVKGDMARQEFALNANKDSRAESELGLAKEEFGVKKDYLKIAQEDLGIRKADLGMRASDQNMEVEKFGWERGDHVKKMEIEAGMKEAAQMGGYTGVIDYLKSADPALAMQFHSLKLQLDDNIMKNDVAKDLVPSLKAKAKMEGYSVMSKGAQAIMKAKPEERDAMYQAMKPVFETVMGKGNAPDSLAEATPYLGIAIAAGTPESQLFENVNKEGKLQPAIAKLQSYKDQLQKAGYSEDSEEMKQVNGELAKSMHAEEDTRAKRQELELKIAQTKQQTRKTLYDSTEKFQNDIDKDSKPYLEYMNNMTSVSGAFETLKKNPRNTQAQGTIGTILASSVQKGALREEDYSRITRSNAGYKYIQENILPKLVSGVEVNLGPSEVANLEAMVSDISKAVTTTQLSREQQYSNKIDIYGNPVVQDGKEMAPAVIDKKAVQLPSMIFKGQQLISKFGFQDEDAPTQALIGRYLAAGKDPAAIKAMLAAKRAPKQQGR
jgi:hypothetical protein